MAGCCGIDFGTSNSALSYAAADEVRLARLEGAAETLPSAVFYPAAVVSAVEKALRECLAQAGVDAAAVELVILTGGTTEVPLLKAAIQTTFPEAAVSEEDKFSSVGLGLGYDSRCRFGNNAAS